MATFEVRCPGASGCPCDFIGRGASMGTARRAVRGHALRQHGRRFLSEAVPLQDLTPEQLAAQLDAFTRAQMGTHQRRAVESELWSSLGDILGSPESTSGFMAGSASVGSRQSVGLVPDLSAGQVAVSASGAPVAVGVPNTAGSLPTTSSAGNVFAPPRGYDGRQMADLLRDNLGRPPAYIVRLLTPTGEVPDPATTFWVSAMAALQSSVGHDLRGLVEDQLAVDPTGQSAFDLGLAAIGRLDRRPLDD